MLVNKHPGQRLSLQNIFLHKWIRKNYYYIVQNKTSKLAFVEHEEEYKSHLLEIQRSLSEIMVADSDYNLPTEKSTEGLSCKTKYIFEQPKNKFVNNGDFLVSKASVSTNDYHSKYTSENIRSGLRVTEGTKENMNLNTVIIIKSSFYIHFLFFKQLLG